jgi:hypothetical protein
MISTTQLVARFHKTFTEDLVKDLAMHIHDAYSDAIQRATGIDREFQRHVIPQIRHYAIQSRVKAIARQHRRLRVVTKFSPTGTEPYSMLRIGNFTLTISMVKAPRTLPRYSDFRGENCQLNDHLYAAFDSVGE